MKSSDELRVFLEVIDKALIKQGLNGLPRDTTGLISYEVARQHSSGDSLADFIVIELTEGSEGEVGVELQERVCKLLLRVRQDIEAGLLAVRTYSPPRKGKKK